MTVNPFKIFLFLLGGSVAAGATAFVSGALDPYLYDQNAAAVAALPEPAPEDPAAPKGERLPVPGEEVPPNTMAATPPPAEDAANPPADATPPADAGSVPTFDVVRVESDGSVVIAGKAFANALVELLNGDILLGSTKATAEGDFAIVLDEPLKPGDYQITLRATPEGGTAVASLETAVLSIPDEPGGQVLAMVEQPGEASELLTVPQPEQPAEPKADEAAAPLADAPKVEEAPKTEEAAAPPAQEEKPADVASAPAEANPPADAPKTEEAATPPAQEEKPADVASAPAETVPPADAPKTEAVATPPAQEEKPAEIASAPAETPPAETTPAPTEAKVVVEAVEIEGSKIFVAGVGDPGHFVRVYANEILLGETMVGQSGRFLVEAQRDLPVGEYIIRADLLGGGGDVIARATVPFEREPGEAIAAVAPEIQQPAEAGAQTEQTPPAATQPEQPAVAADETPPAEAPAPQPEQPAVAADEAPPVDAPTPQPEQPAVAADETPPADTAPQPEQPAVAADEAKPDQPAAPQPEQPAVAANETPPANEAAAETVPPASEPAQTAPEVAAAEPEQPAAPAEAAPEVAAEPPAAEAEIAAAPPETVSPKLQKVQGSVIIRRSDTLWRISRRVYGRGIRYWTIYLANQNQIADPDRIWPGQVFTVPDKSREGEPADMSAMGSQMTTTTTTE